jgi:predicted DCC family thiol-disulfide oxidoreductase YuxK
VHARSAPADPAAASAPRSSWSVLYDAGCGFCTWAVAVLLAWDRGGRLRPCAIQSPDGARLLGDLDPEARLVSWHLVSPTGERRSGGAALAPLLGLLPGGAPAAALAAAAPALGEGAYRRVADHRSALSRLLPARAKRRAQASVRRAEAGPEASRPQ